MSHAFSIRHPENGGINRADRAFSRRRPEVMYGHIPAGFLWLFRVAGERMGRRGQSGHPSHLIERELPRPALAAAARAGSCRGSCISGIRGVGEGGEWLDAGGGGRGRKHPTAKGTPAFRTRRIFGQNKYKYINYIELRG